MMHYICSQLNKIYMRLNYTVLVALHFAFENIFCIQSVSVSTCGTIKIVSILKITFMDIPFGFTHIFIGISRYHFYFRHFHSRGEKLRRNYFCVFSSKKCNLYINTNTDTWDRSPCCANLVTCSRFWAHLFDRRNIVTYCCVLCFYIIPYSPGVLNVNMHVANGHEFR